MLPRSKGASVVSMLRAHPNVIDLAAERRALAQEHTFGKVGLNKPKETDKEDMNSDKWLKWLHLTGLVTLVISMLFVLFLAMMAYFVLGVR